jgi:hypothetical protein
MKNLVEDCSHIEDGGIMLLSLDGEDCISPEPL